MYTSRMRMTGSSGMDIDSIVTDLMKAESQRLYKMKRESILLTWKQEAYRNTAKTLNSFQSTYLDTLGAKKMHLPMAYKNFTSSVRASGGANADAVKVTTDHNSSEGEYKVKVLKLAEKASIQGAQKEIKSEPAYTEAKVVDGIFGDKGATSFMVRYDGTIKEIDLTKYSNENDSFAKLKADYAAANTDEKKAALASRLEAAINDRLKEAFGTEYNDKATVKDISEGVDNDDIKDNKVSVSITAKGLSFQDSNNRIIVSGLKSVGIEENSSNVRDSVSLLGSLGVDGDKKISINGKEIDVYGEMTVESLINEINNSGAGVKLSFDKASQTYKIETTDTGQMAQIGFDDEFTKNLMADAFGIAKSDKTYKAGSDSVIQVNGQTIQSATNSVKLDSSVGGTILHLQETTVDKVTNTANEITITINKDNDKLFNDIKDFINAYNELIDSLQTELKTARPKSDKYSYYEPLLDEEKEGLSDSEIQKMEEKGKTGLLRSDSILSSIVTGMRAAMNTKVDLGDSRFLSLYEIGISTSSDITKGAKLEIDEAKLKKAIEERGDDIAKLFTGSTSGGNKVDGIANLLDKEIVKATNKNNGTITKKAGIENYTSAADNSIYHMLQDKNRRIESMLDALAKKEDAYYRKFSAMERAMNTSQNQLSSLMSQLGM